MEVDVTLFPPLRENRFSKRTVRLAESATVQSVLDKLVIDREQVESIYVNGKEATFYQSLNAGDRITFLPFIGGG
jgi:molybdopterin converting factor small subunit